jgi:light-harvesting complex 1 beta chain
VAVRVTAIPAAREVRGNGRKANLEVRSMADARGTLSGLTDSEAKEFHGIFVTSFIVFLVIAIIAHILAWQWCPWTTGAACQLAAADLAQSLTLLS